LLLDFNFPSHLLQLTLISCFCEFLHQYADATNEFSAIGSQLGGHNPARRAGRLALDGTGYGPSQKIHDQQ
jgi:hypothetical protein